jgi:hypothetical protein
VTLCHRRPIAAVAERATDDLIAHDLGVVF